MAITKPIQVSEEEVFIVDVLTSVITDMKVPVLPLAEPVSYLTINFEPGRNNDIIDALMALDKNQTSELKYPLIAAVMPIPERNSSGFLEITFPRIVIANLTKTNTGTEKIPDKYSSDGVFKTILRPCLREFIKQLAFSIYTGMGDPEMYEYTMRELPSKQTVAEQLPNDFVDIIEILNLKVILNHLKNCSK